MLDPVRESQWEVEFYQLRRDLTIDVPSLESRIVKGNVSALVIIHYFGRTDPEAERIQRIAQAHGVIVIEDLAHALFSAQHPENRAGKLGDVLFYSLHKMLPMESGGVGVYRNSALVSSQSTTRPDLVRSYLSYDLVELGARRHANYRQLATLLQSQQEYGGKFTLLWNGVSSYDAPQSLPVRILRGSRDSIYHNMNYQGIGVVSLYHTLIPELRKHESMLELSEQVINFPVHQDVNQGDLYRVAEVFRACLT